MICCNAVPAYRATRRSTPRWWRRGHRFRSFRRAALLVDPFLELRIVVKRVLLSELGFDGPGGGVGVFLEPAGEPATAFLASGVFLCIGFGGFAEGFVGFAVHFSFLLFLEGCGFGCEVVIFVIVHEGFLLRRLLFLWFVVLVRLIGLVRRRLVSTCRRFVPH